VRRSGGNLLERLAGLVLIAAADELLAPAARAAIVVLVAGKSATAVACLLMESRWEKLRRDCALETEIGLQSGPDSIDRIPRLIGGRGCGKGRSRD